MRLSHNGHFMTVPWLALVGCALALVGCANGTGQSDSVPLQKGPKPEKSFILDEGVDLTMVFLEGGNFVMGSAQGDRERGKLSEMPTHNVEIAEFWIGKFEVTNAQYVAIMGEETRVNRGGEYKRFDRHSQGPVGTVRWKEAVEFCKRVSARTGWDFSLPTEEQWEYACRAGSTTRFYFGDDELKLGAYAWYSGNKSMWKEYGTPRNVGLKRPNDWGLYDMHGNVWEWCLDRYEDDYFKERFKKPADRERYEKRGSIPRVTRGGRASNAAFGCRSASRGWTYENAAAGAGFRVVAMPPDDEIPPAGAETDT